LFRRRAEFKSGIRLSELGRNARRTGVVQKRCAVIQRTGGNWLVIAPAAHTTAATTPVGAATTATTESSALWPGFIHGEGAPFQGLAVKSLDCSLHVFFVGEFDETKSSGFARHLVTDDDRGNNLKPSVGDEFTEHIVGHTAGKVSHE
jgi:hypothetical protein